MCCLQLLPLSLWFHLLCRAPNPDTVLIVQTPLGVFSAKSLLQNKKKAGSRLISSNRAKIEEILTEETTELEPFSAARCRIFKRLNNNKKVLQIKVLDLHVRFNLSENFIVRTFFQLLNCIWWQDVSIFFPFGFKGEGHPVLEIVLKLLLG